MTAADFPEILRECMYTHEVFRRLGIPAQDIFLAVTDDSIGVTVRQGFLQGSVRVGSRAGMTDAEINAKWDALVTLWNADGDNGWDFAGSTARRMAVTIMVNMNALGFRFTKPS